MISMDLPPPTAAMVSKEGDPLKGGERDEAVVAPLVKVPKLESSTIGKIAFEKIGRVSST